MCLYKTELVLFLLDPFRCPFPLHYTLLRLLSHFYTTCPHIFTTIVSFTFYLKLCFYSFLFLLTLVVFLLVKWMGLIQFPFDVLSCSFYNLHFTFTFFITFSNFSLMFETSVGCINNIDLYWFFLFHLLPFHQYVNSYCLVPVSFLILFSVSIIYFSFGLCVFTAASFLF